MCDEAAAIVNRDGDAVMYRTEDGWCYTFLGRPEGMTGSEVKELAATVRRESAPPDGGGSDPEGGRRKMVLSPRKFRAILTGLGERNSSFLPLANVFESLWYGEITEEELEEEWAEFVAKLHFDYFEKLKADGRIKGVNV